MKIGPIHTRIKEDVVQIIIYIVKAREHMPKRHSWKWIEWILLPLHNRKTPEDFK